MREITAVFAIFILHDYKIDAWGKKREVDFFFFPVIRWFRLRKSFLVDKKIQPLYTKKRIYKSTVILNNNKNNSTTCYWKKHQQQQQQPKLYVI